MSYPYAATARFAARAPVVVGHPPGKRNGVSSSGTNSPTILLYIDFIFFYSVINPIFVGRRIYDGTTLEFTVSIGFFFFSFNSD